MRETMRLLRPSVWIRLVQLHQASLSTSRRRFPGGYPVVFGFPVYKEFVEPDQNGNVLYPALGSQAIDGHAIVAVGYDETHAIGGEQGALIVRNSWGPEWCLNGYAYMSYRYVTSGLANDWWTMTKQQWLDTGRFD